MTLSPVIVTWWVGKGGYLQSSVQCASLAGDRAFFVCAQEAAGGSEAGAHGCMSLAGSLGKRLREDLRRAQRRSSKT